MKLRSSSYRKMTIILLAIDIISKMARWRNIQEHLARMKEDVFRFEKVELFQGHWVDKYLSEKEVEGETQYLPSDKRWQYLQDGSLEEFKNSGMREDVGLRLWKMKWCEANRGTEVDEEFRRRGIWKCICKKTARWDEMRCMMYLRRRPFSDSLNENLHIHGYRVN